MIMIMINFSKLDYDYDYDYIFMITIMITIKNPTETKLYASWNSYDVITLLCIIEYRYNTVCFYSTPPTPSHIL